MKRSMKRYLAMLLAMTLVLQQGGTITLADEKEPASETVVEKTTEAKPSEKRAEENKPEEKKPEETKEPESKAPETKPEAPKTEENKTAETKSEETNAPDAQTGTQTDDTTTEAGTGDAEKNTDATEPTTQAGTESEAVTEGTTEGETQTASGQEKESEKDSESETEKKEEAQLEVSVMQEVFQKTVDDATVPMVKYTVKIANKTETADAEGATLKVLLADALSYKKEEGETPELISFENLGKAIEATAFAGEELNEEQKTAYANGNVVLWKDQTVAAGAEKTFVFCAEVKDGQMDVDALKNLWLVNGEAVTDEKLQWTNTELLEVKKELPSEFTYENDNMIVTATLAEGTILPEGAKFVVTEEELPEEYRALVGETLEDGQILAGYVYYDMHFEVDGQEIEPENGTVTVSVAYKNPLQLSDSVDETAQEDTEYKVLHLTDEQTVEEVTDNVAATDDGQVNEMGFTTDSFSGFMLIGTNDAITEKEITAEVTCPGAPEGTQFDFVFYIEGDETNSKQRLKSIDGEVSFTIRSDSLMNAKESEKTSTGKTEYYTGVLKQLPRATVDKVTFDETEWTVKIAKKIDRTTGKSSLETVSFYKKDSTEAAEKIEFNNTYQRAYFNRYSMAGLLNGYNVIAFSNATLGNHTVGGVLVGGDLDASISNVLGESSLLSGADPVPSYVAGKMTTKFTYGGAGENANTKGALYLGSTNKVNIEYEQNSDSYYYKWVNDEGTGSTKQNGAPVYNVDYPYVDFGMVKSILVGTMEHYANSATQRTAENSFYDIPAGTSAKIVVLDSSATINVSGYDSATNAQNTYITVTDSGTVNVGTLTINGIQVDTGDDPIKKEKAEATTLVWYFPNATTVNLPSCSWFGHVIAPNATINGGNGNYAGAMVGNIVITNNEGHCYPYRGDTGFNLGLEFNAKKTLVDSDGNSVELQADEFEFTLTPTSGNGNDPIKNAITAKNSADGKVSFGTFVYTEAGIYTYTVKESAGSESGIEYDGAEYTVTVKVTERADNELVADVQIVKTVDGKETTEKEIAFKNEKTKGSASAELKVKKEYNGTFPTEDGKKFEFVLTAGSNTAKDKEGKGIPTPMPAGSKSGSRRVTVTDTNETTFGKITYTEDGTYYYTITETKGSLEDVTYDSNVYEIEVTVGSQADGTKNVTVKSRVKAENGKEPAPYEGSENIFTATFKNVHKTEEAGTTELKVQKNFTEDNKAIVFPAEGFTFELAATTGASMPAGSSEDGKKTVTVKNSTAMGFGEIKYTTNGTYTYTIREVIPTDAKKVDNKYVKDGITYDVTVYTVTVDVKSKTDGTGKDVTVSSDPKFTTDKTATFTNTYQETTSISVKKVWVGDTKALRPESIEVQLQRNGAAYGSAVTLNEANGWKYSWTDLPKVDNTGADITYTVKEISKVPGYTTAYSTDSETGKVTITNTITSVKVSKVDVMDSKELAGAHIQILDSTGKVVEEWDSAKEAHEVKGLKTGEIYTLKETVAPAGYTVTAETTFTLKEDGTIDSSKTTTKSKDGVLLVEDSLNKINIEKVDENNVPLAGAKLVVKDASGNIAKDVKGKELIWTTDGKPHEVTGLAPGIYTLSELEAPKGYQVSKDVPFEIKGNETKDAVITVTMKDEPLKPTSRSLRVTKELSMEGISPEAHIIVKSAIYYVALFEDEARTSRVSDVKKIVFANQESSYATFKDLEADKTYYIGETDKYGTLIPNGKLSPDLFYYPTYGADATFTFKGDTTEGLAGFTNVYVEWPDYFYLSGQLTVTKQVLLGGEECDSDDVFYARVFNDAKLRDPVSDEVLVLDMAGGSRTSVTVTNLPIGDKPGSSRKYYVAETDEYGNPLDPDEVTEYTISVDKSEITLDASSANPEVVITNDFHEEESEFESESEVDEKKTAPKTGDDTDFAKYLFLLALSTGLGATALGQKRRKAKRVRK